MLNEQTMEKMNEMKLSAMAEAFELQLSSGEHAKLSFEERIGLMVDCEWTAREQRKLTRRLRSAKPRYKSASLEDVDFKHPRRLKRQQVLSLGSCSWIQGRHNLLITGPTGIGKSYLACAFVERACRRGFTARYVRMSRLLHEIAVTGRRILHSPADPPGQTRSPGDRRLAAGASTRRRTTRPDRGHRRPRRMRLDADRRPTPGRRLARGHRRSHPGRRHLRPLAAQCPSHRPQGAVETTNEDCTRYSREIMIHVAPLRRPEDYGSCRSHGKPADRFPTAPWTGYARPQAPQPRQRLRSLTAKVMYDLFEPTADRQGDR